MSVAFYGDYDTTETVIIPFNTFDSNDPTASVTITNLVAGDLHIHKDGGTTQRSSSAGVTVSIDFDSITGNHIASIDLSDNTDAGFYSDGSRIQVRMEGTTVDGGTINAWIGSFSIGCTLRSTTPGRTLDVTASGAAGIDWANVEGQGTSVDLSATAIDLCDDVTLVATTTTNTDMRGTDSAALAATIGTPANIDSGGATIADNIKKLADDSGGLSFDATSDSLEAIRDRGDAAWTTGGGTGLTALATGTAQSGTASTIVLAGASTFADNVLNGNVINIHTGTGAGQSRVITSNTLADDTCNVTPNWATNPSSDSQYEIVQGSTNEVAVSLTPQTANDNGADLSTLTGTNGALLDDNAITSAKYDESTAFPLTAVNGSTLTEAGGDGDHLTAINLPNQTMDITGSLSGSVGSVTAAVTTDSASRTASQADVSDIPTNAEFNARTLPSADYVLTSDTIAGVTLVATTTDVTNQVSADVTAISGDSSAADNLEATYDGTGYVNDVAPATQSQVSQIDDTIDANTSIISILEDTGTTIPGQISGLNDISTAEVNTEVDNALNTAIPATGSTTAGSINDYVRRTKFGAVNKMEVDEDDGDARMYDDSGTLFNTVSAAFTSASTITKREKLL